MFDTSRFLPITTSDLKLTGVMSMDENGLLYAASEDSAIYRLSPWSNEFELFAGFAGKGEVAKAYDGDRIGSKDSPPIVGPVTSIDALGSPGCVYMVDQGRDAILLASTEEGGKVRTIRLRSNHEAHVLSFPFSGEITSAYRYPNESRRFHPSLTNRTATAVSSKDPTWCHVDGSTHNLGANSTLGPNPVYPLATLAPNFTICASTLIPRGLQGVVVELGVVRSQLPNGIYTITETSYPARLYGNWMSGQGVNNAFLFSPASNMMYAWNDTTKVLMRYYNIISPFTLNLLDIKESPFSMPEFKLDFSSLRPALHYHDLILENKYSGLSWNVHKDVLALHMPNTPDFVAKLHHVIGSTRIPDGSISAFVDFLYLKPLIAGSEWIKFFAELCHIIFLCEALDIKCSNASSLLETQIEAHLAPTEAADMLFEFWFDPDIEWSTSSSVINLLARKSSTIEISELLAQLKSCEKPLTSGVRAMELAFKLTSIKSWKLDGLSDSLNVTVPVPSARVLIDPKRSLQYKTDFAFGADHHWTTVKGWILYPQWLWFKNLIDSGLEESKTRLVSMPPWVTINIIRAIILTTYQQNTGSALLREEEMTLILERGSEIGLVDESKCAVTPFEPLVARCQAMLLGTITKHTCLRLLKVYHRLQLKDQVDATLKFASGIMDSLPLRELEPELRKLIEDY